ncbi:MAG: TylF/MycF family methyltransferase [Actinomycetota bacterium]|nr:TylF/MycF family methyltransferase [Actinomycetota bacterium]
MSNEGPFGRYLQAGSRLAGRLRRRTVRVIGTPQRQRQELAEARAKLTSARGQLKSTQGELKAARQELRAAKLDRDTRKLPEPVERTVRAVRAEHLTFLTLPALRDLAVAVLDLDRNQTPGLIVEAGTALGGSAIVLATAKAPERRMKVYDVFGLIPEPSERDGADVHDRYQTIKAGEAKGFAGETYYGYRENLYDEVTQSFVRLGVPPAENEVELIQGLFQDTVNVEEPVALAHLDGDWYDSTMTCLERLTPQLVPGGRIVLDDYEMWSGCRAAVDDYFRNRIMDFRFERHQRLHVVRR